MIRRTMFLGVLLVPGMHASVFGEVIHVPGDQPSIQAAIDVAADGDRIIVAPGTYFENIDLLGKAVTLRSSAGPDATIIDAGGKGAVITCVNEEGPDTVIDGFTITGGSGTRGGGMEIDCSSPTVIDCTFLGNTAIIGGGMAINDPPSSPTVIGCTFLGNTASIGGGMAINDRSSPLVSNCSFIQNIAVPENDQGRGGGVFNENSDSTFINCTFLGNTASGDGGGVENRGPGNRTLTLVNCLLAGNSSGFGGGLSSFFDIDTVVVNCTFVGNMANDGGAISALVNSSTTVINSILWGNSAVGLGPQILAFDSTITVMHSDVQGGPADFGGDGPFDYFPSNIDADPLFVDADGADNDPDTLGDNDYRLAAGSPCIDAADSADVLLCILDLDTDERVVDDPDTRDTGDGGPPVVDMGAYEFDSPSLPDCNGNGMEDGCEVLEGIASDCNDDGVPDTCVDLEDDCNGNQVPDECIDLEDDCNGNAVPDACDITDGTSEDCTGNGLPDECEPDCNDNGVADSCDILDGISTDCTGNGLPDECEPDCNDNGVADSCDILDGTSEDCAGEGIPDECEPDCNDNGIADSCDVAAGTSADCDGDIVPDECQDTSTDCNDNGIWDACDIDHGTSEDQDGNLIPDECEEDEVFHVDDDAPGDPAPGDPSISDPEEDGSSEHPFDAIQEAIAVTIFGDTIIVAPGTYFENINMLGKAITLHSSTGPEVTTIDGNGSGTVVKCVNGEGPDTLIEGFTLTGGQALVNPEDRGGGMRVEASSPTLVNCIFSGNTAVNGGGMSNFGDSSPTVTNCTFSGNTAGLRGGGMYNSRASSPTVTDCIFSENTAQSGGGMYNHSDSSPMLTECTFSSNAAEICGGGMSNIFDSHPTLTNCTFNSNTALTGGGMRNFVGSPTLTNCTFNWNAAGSGGGMANASSSPTMTHCTFNGNTVDGNGGGIQNALTSSPTLTNCKLSDNSANRGGGIFNVQSSSPVLTDCALSDNSASFSGGGLYNANLCSPTLTNCTLSGNSANSGGGMYNLQNSHPAVANCILWNESGTAIVDTGGASTTVRYSNIEGGWPGVGNIDADPMFIDAEGPDDDPNTADDNDYRLAAGSPCIDAADNTVVPKGVVMDLDGNPRFIDDPDTDDTGFGKPPIVDMGAYELQDPCADDDGDGRVTICHIPPGNPDNAHTITVSVNALPAHLAHGDACGPCEEDDGLLLRAGESEVCSADVNGDGSVGAFDLAIVLAGSQERIDSAPLQQDRSCLIPAWIRAGGTLCAFLESSAGCGRER